MRRYTRDRFVFTDGQEMVVKANEGYKIGSLSVDQSAEITSDTKVYIEFRAIPVNSYTVSFETYGGSAVASQKVVSGSTVKEPAAPTKEGSEFAGWFDKNGQRWDFANRKIAGNITIYAHWNRKSDPKPTPTPTPVYNDSKEERESLFTGTWNNPVKSGAWSQDAQGIWHYASSETFRNTWAYILNPYAHDGQNTSDWFWFDRQGNMLTGWQFINEKWYYLHPYKDGVLGSCLIGPAVTPDGWTVDESGAWIESIPRK